MEKLIILKHKYEKALLKLEEILNLKSNNELSEIIRDSAIQRFEYCFDLSWKTLKYYLEYNYGSICNSPKSCFRLAFSNNVVEYDEYWLKICDYRNLTAHTYEENIPQTVYNELEKIIGYFRILFDKIQI